ncbi:hypothetical protein [Streptomyces sp. F-7]|uniref:hypothetical protein n=1 Tax=Streptomyces sp. F-7 TaxID=573566 RepID=UPI000A83D4AB|nr:hypothetical protein [Streptomyces sp. F-7]
MDQVGEPENAADTRRTLRFSQLPERIRLENTVGERPASPPAVAGVAVTPDWWLIRMGGI